MHYIDYCLLHFRFSRMLKLKIETFSNDSGNIEDTLTVPLAVAKTLLKFLPANLAAKFDENGEQLQDLVSAIADAKQPGIILEFDDQDEDQRIVFSVC